MLGVAVRRLSTSARARRERIVSGRRMRSLAAHHGPPSPSPRSCRPLPRALFPDRRAEAQRAHCVARCLSPRDRADPRPPDGAGCDPCGVFPSPRCPGPPTRLPRTTGDLNAAMPQLRPTACRSQPRNSSPQPSRAGTRASQPRAERPRSGYRPSAFRRAAHAGDSPCRATSTPSCLNWRRRLPSASCAARRAWHRRSFIFRRIGAAAEPRAQSLYHPSRMGGTPPCVPCDSGLCATIERRRPKRPDAVALAPELLPAAEALPCPRYTETRSRPP